MLTYWISLESTLFSWTFSDKSPWSLGLYKWASASEPERNPYKSDRTKRYPPPESQVLQTAWNNLEELSLLSSHFHLRLCPCLTRISTCWLPRPFRSSSSKVKTPLCLLPPSRHIYWEGCHRRGCCNRHNPFSCSTSRGSSGLWEWLGSAIFVHRSCHSLPLRPHNLGCQREPCTLRIFYSGVVWGWFEGGKNGPGIGLNFCGSSSLCSRNVGSCFQESLWYRFLSFIPL